MKKAMLVLVLCGLAFLPSVVLAEEGHAGHEHAGGTQRLPQEEAAPRASAQTVTGEVVDLACYLGHGEKGASHRDCAEKCITSGLPVGIKTADALYLVIGGEHGPANQTLASLAAKQVEAEGTVTERDGVRLLALKKVTVQE